jgi:hypothetical protein
VLGLASRAEDGVAFPPGLAQGAVVVPPGGNGVADVHGALVGWFGPEGVGAGAREETRDDAHGAAVPLAGGIPPLLAIMLGSAIGSRRPDCILDEGFDGWGWFVVCTLD